MQQVSSRYMEDPREEITVESDILEEKATKISLEGIEFIKYYEGCKLQAYKLDGERYYTIGYGHYGPDVKAGQTITEEQAERLLLADLEGYTNLVVNECEYLNLNQCELNALVSFAYNCGLGNLKKLTANGTRSKEEIAEHITAYTKSSSESNRKGLLTRRQAEKEMFERGDTNEEI